MQLREHLSNQNPTPESVPKDCLKEALRVLRFVARRVLDKLSFVRCRLSSITYFTLHKHYKFDRRWLVLLQSTWDSFSGCYTESTEIMSSLKVEAD